jgi:hypothetical protein
MARPILAQICYLCTIPSHWSSYSPGYSNAKGVNPHLNNHLVLYGQIAGNIQ